MISIMALGTGHAGFDLKEACKGWVLDRDRRILDFGSHSTESIDRLDHAAQVADAVTWPRVERGDPGSGGRLTECEARRRPRRRGRA